MMLLVSQDYRVLNDRTISEHWVKLHVEGDSCCPVCGTVPAFSCRNWETPRKTLVREEAPIVEVSVGVRW
jgi:hypothetical protein